MLGCFSMRRSLASFTNSYYGCDVKRYELFLVGALGGYYLCCKVPSV